MAREWRSIHESPKSADTPLFLRLSAGTFLTDVLN
jgi:hypothetical protein